MAISSETELYAPVKTFLEGLGYEVKSEVQRCDIVAVRQGEEQPLIVELKKTFTLPLVYQGIDRLSLSDQVYLAVEAKGNGRGASASKQRWGDAVKLCRMLGLGLLTVRFYKTMKPRVEILLEPAPYEPRKSKRRTARLLYEFKERSGDYNVGGSNNRKIMTAYREKALHCAHLLHEHGPLSPRQLRELTGNGKISGILQKDYYGWFARQSRGIYQLTPAGIEAVHTYAEVIIAKRAPT